MFGISQLSDPRIPPGSASTAFNHGSSLAVLSGAPSRKYFFLNKALPRELKGNEIPRYTDEDRDALAKEHWNDVLKDGVKLKDLFETKIRAVLVPLENYVFPRWHFGRIMTIGDAAHKVGPAYQLSHFLFHLGLRANA